MNNFINYKNITFYLLIIIIISGIFLRFYNYNFQDFWWDELIDFANSDPNLTLKQTYQNVHNLTVGTNFSFEYASNANLYFYVYKFIFNLFSYTPSTARLIVVFFGILVFLLSIIIYKRNIGKNLLLISTLISFNYYLVIQSQEFKSNIFFCFISLVSIFYFFLFINNESFINKKITKILYFLFTFLTIWTHLFGFIILFSQCFTLLIKNRKILLENLLYYFSLPLIYFFINFQQIVNFSEIKEFHHQVNKEFFLDYHFKYFFGSIISGKIFLFIFLILFVYNFKKLIKSKIEIIFLITVIFFSYFLPLIYSLISKPILHTRYIIYIVPCIIFLLVYMINITELKKIKNVISFIVISLVISNTTYSLYVLKKNDKPHITEVLSKINAYEKKNKTYVVASSPYLLNYLNRSKKFENFNLFFISCKKLNSLNVKSWWELKIFPEFRFKNCKNILERANKNINLSENKKIVRARYAFGYLMVKN